MTTCQRRNTRQRQVILEVLQSAGGHPTAGELYRTVRQEMPTISLGTVYRNLEILQETGDVVRLSCCTGQEARYDGLPHPHLHFMCEQCEAIVDLKAVLPVVDNMIGSPLEGHEVNGYHVVLRGICRNCLR